MRLQTALIVILMQKIELKVKPCLQGRSLNHESFLPFCPYELLMSS